MLLRNKILEHLRGMLIEDFGVWRADSRPGSPTDGCGTPGAAEVRRESSGERDPIRFLPEHHPKMFHDFVLQP